MSGEFADWMAYYMAEAAIDEEREMERARTGGGARTRVSAPYVPARERGVTPTRRWGGSGNG